MNSVYHARFLFFIFFVALWGPIHFALQGHPNPKSRPPEHSNDHCLQPNPQPVTATAHSGLRAPQSEEDGFGSRARLRKRLRPWLQSTIFPFPDIFQSPQHPIPANLRILFRFSPQNRKSTTELVTYYRWPGPLSPPLADPSARLYSNAIG